MTVRPIDMQVVIAQQVNVAGHEQAQQNAAVQAQAQELKKIPDKTHERETQIEKQGESNKIEVDEREAERKRRGSGGKKRRAGWQEEKEAEQKVDEEGKGVRFDVTT